MSPSAQPAKPLEILRQQITRLEAAITLALARPKKETIHLLRTSTRRIEAQLALLDLLSPNSTSKHRKRSIRLLGQLRRAAGEVRDLDVARDLLKHPASLENAALPQGPEEQLASAASLHRHLERDCKDLRRSLRHQRSIAAASLVAVLRHHGPALARSLERLLASLSVSDETRALTVSPTRLSTLTDGWVRSRLPAETGPDPSSKDLHGIRKVAKLARYMAESTPATASLARTYESLQQAGGTWHDFLYLHDLAHHELGRHAPLTALLAHLTDASCSAYQASLAAAPASGDGQGKHKAV